MEQTVHQDDFSWIIGANIIDEGSLLVIQEHRQADIHKQTSQVLNSSN